MTTQSRTDIRSPENGREQPATLVRPAATEPHATDTRPSVTRRRRPFGWLTRNGRRQRTQAANGRPNGRTPERTDGPNGRTQQRTQPPNGRTARPSVVPRVHNLMLSVLVATTVVTGLSSLVFSYGNVRRTLIGLGWSSELASLYTPAVDVTVIGLILVTQYLVTAGIAPERLAKPNWLMAAAAFAMLGANVVPSVITGLTKDEPQAYGRALADAVLPAILIAWSHIGPYLLGLFAEIRANAQAAARDIEVQRTIATDADRAAAAAALTDARQDAERIRTDAAEELAAAASVRQREELAAQQSRRERTAAEQQLAARLAEQERTTLDRIGQRERTAETDAARRTRDAELLAQRAESELAEARRVLAQVATERAAAASDREAAADDRRAAEELLASVPSERTRERTSERTERTDDQRGGGTATATPIAGRMSVAQRVELWKARHPGWASMALPSQQELRDFFPGLSSGDTLSKIRQKIDEDKKAA